MVIKFLLMVTMTLVMVRLGMAIAKFGYHDGLLSAAAQRAVMENQAGYPARESEISTGKFYLCDVSLQDQWPDRTNYFLVLQEMVPNGKYWKIIPGQKRLFQVSRSVSRGLIYRAERANGITALIPVDGLPPKED